MGQEDRKFNGNCVYTVDYEVKVSKHRGPPWGAIGGRVHIVRLHVHNKHVQLVQTL